MRNFFLRFLTSLIGLCFMAAFAVAQSPKPNSPPASTPITPFKVVGEYPHDMEAFTQGLLFHDGVLYEGTGHYTKSRIRRVDISSGRVLQEWPFPNQLFGEGLTLLGDHLFALSWRSGVGLVLERESFNLVAHFQYDGPGWGITDDERHLYMSDGTDRLYIRDPATFEIVRTIDVKYKGRPIIKLNELEWINGEIWANIWKEKIIVRIDPKTGEVIGWLDLTEIVNRTKNADNVDNVLNGIAHDPKTGRVFVTGKYWPVMYELEVKGLKPVGKKSSE